MAKLVIRGGRRLSGRHVTTGNKNAALPMLAAAMLTDEPVCLTNLPLIDDVRTMLALLEDLGVQVDLHGHEVTLCAAGIRKRTLNEALCRKVRSSILFSGPMAARYGRVTLFPPGGDAIGRRPLDTHLSALGQLGIVVHGDQRFAFSRGPLEGARILLDEASVTATENVVMAAVLARGETILFNAACEPHVQDLCMMLNAMGAQITGIGTNRLGIQGVDALHGVSHRVSPDYIDTATFAAAAVLTGGDMQIENVREDDLAVIGRPFRKLGVSWSLLDGVLSLPAGQRLRVHDAFGSAVPKIEDGIWPSVPSDLLSLLIVMATQASGTVLFFEKLFESRLYFVDRLIEMGARIVPCDPHRILVTGPARLRGMRVSSPDIRAGMALVLAALCARGESVIHHAESIDRGYEQIDQELKRLGADLVRED